MSVQNEIQKKDIGVYGILVKNNKILLVRKTRGPYIGKFDLPGGSLKHGEKVTCALLRELEEEVGLKIAENDVAIWDNLSTMITFYEGSEKISFFHIGLLYLVHNFKSKNIKQGIREEDVNGSAWIPLSTSLEGLSPFARNVVEKIR